VPVAISLNMSGFNIAMAIAAAAGGVIVDRWGASVLALAGVPLVLGALGIWVMVRR
jgi:predicted MFS family arabinose efflux permease